MDTQDERLREALSIQIRVEITSRGWTQAELAERAGLARETLSRYMRGRIAMPLSVYFALARAFGMEPDELMRLARERRDG